MVAFGFWNPFHVALDAFGRLFAVDNDPDSLPPCRLLHIVPGGNYGYRYRNGRKGVHPFTAWNGELPGTLPMVSGTGEAPSGLVAYESDQLPADYIGDLLVTVLGRPSHRALPAGTRGASFRSLTEPIVTGDENFRPVGIAVAPDGSLYRQRLGAARTTTCTAKDACGTSRPSSRRPSIVRRNRPKPFTPCIDHYAKRLPGNCWAKVRAASSG